ncbi:MAG: NfeD family protein [Muribaculaceae bacterium]|nr:NfeD family protein [Muribaculaceae bacterium]
METWIIWLIIAVLLVIVEVLSQMMWTLCLAIGCLAGLLAAIFGFNITWQIVMVAVISVVAFTVVVPVLKRWHNTTSRRANRDDRTGMEALLGRHAVVTESIYPDRLGRVRIDGDSWQVSAPLRSGVIERGEEVVVTSYDSIILHVKRVRV